MARALLTLCGRVEPVEALPGRAPRPCSRVREAEFRVRSTEVCKKWAWRVLDEFFEQGDEEKRLSLPVGMLNDREKINRPLIIAN